MFTWPASPPLAVPPVDVRVNDELRLRDGRRISLAWAGPSTVTRIPAGWLVAVGTETPTTWLLRDDGTKIEFPAAAYPVLSPDGRRLAYRSGNMIVVAEIKATGLHTVASTAGVGKFHPTMFAGEALLLSYTETGGGPDGYDLWYPSRGPYRPTPRSGILVAATLPGTTALLGFAGASCLALIDLATLAPTRRACDLDIIPIWDIPVSPDGHWALVSTYGDQGGSKEKDPGNGIAVIDLTTVFDQPGLAAQWPDSPNLSIALDETCVWPGPATALCGSRGGLVRVPVTAPDAATHLVFADVPTEPGTDGPYLVRPVRHLGDVT